MSGTEIVRSLDFASIQRHLAEIEEFIESTRDEQAVLDVIERARIIKALGNAQKGAAMIAAAAVRVEVLALRRLGQLGHYLRGKRTMQEWLVSLDQPSLGAVLDSGATATKAYRDMLAERERASGAAWRAKSPKEQWDVVAREGFDADPQYGPDRKWVNRSLAESAYEVLASAIAADEVFTTGEATARLIEELDADPDLAPALAEAVREAIRADAAVVRQGGIAVPRVITFFDGNKGWIHVPWSIATLGQLRWMAEFRADQARQLQDRADALADLVKSLFGTGVGSDTRLVDLMDPIVEVAA